MKSRRLLHILAWLLALALVSWVMRQVPLAETGAALRGLRWWQIGLFALANGAVVLALNGRWWAILVGLGWRVQYGRLALHRLTAFAVSYFTPGPQFGGEPVQVWLAARDGVPRSAAVTAVALDKTVELLANFGFLLAGVTVILQTGFFGERLGGGMVMFALALFLLPLGLLAAIWRGKRPFSQMWRVILRLWPRLPTAVQIGQAIQTSETQMTTVCQESPRPLMAAVLFSVISWLALVGEYWLMFGFLGAEMTAVQTIIIMTAARIAFLLPLPGGLGLLEAGQAAAASALGFNPALGVSAALLIRARDIALALIGFGWGAFVSGTFSYEEITNEKVY